MQEDKFDCRDCLRHKTVDVKIDAVVSFIESHDVVFIPYGSSREVVTVVTLRAVTRDEAAGE